ncbi:hypothetical protein AAVH_09842 [Aphelenchoides avenae]|nr:hypothetical protein AAVH_09842 [Aphelenchus avenae]
MQPITAVVLLTVLSIAVGSQPHHLWGEGDDVRDFYYREVGRHVLETNIHYVEHVVVARTAGVEFQGAPFTDGHKGDPIIVIQQANQTLVSNDTCRMTSKH